jgi:hypothetical protein
MIGQRFNSTLAEAVVPTVERGSRDAELVQRAFGRQVRLFDKLDDLGLLGCGVPHAWLRVILS